MKFFYLNILLFLFMLPANAQLDGDSVLSGPMVASVQGTSTKVWILLEKQAANSSIGVFIENINDGTNIDSYNILNSYCVGDTCSYMLNFSNLSNGGNYKAFVTIDNVIIDSSGLFRVNDGIVEDVDFLIGSCNAMNNYEGPNGMSGTQILDSMTSDQTDFMLWLGDNLYIRYPGLSFPDEYTDTTKMFDRWVRMRTHPNKRKFMQSRFQLASWDDHDFGPNNAGSDYAYRDWSINTFKNFWYNGEVSGDGVYSSYKYSDIQFFITDNRSFQNRQDYLGRTQLEWLKNELQESTATFKFVIIGSAVHWPWEKDNEISFFQSGERDELYDFIYYNNISGVAFLSGDKHQAYIAKYEANCSGTYPLYEFMSSPMTSNVSTEEPDYYDIIYRYNEHNYGKIKVTGTQGNRVCTFEIKNKNKEIVHSFVFSEDDLRASFDGTSSVPTGSVLADYDFEGSANDSSPNLLHASLVGPELSTSRWGASESAYAFSNYPNTINFPNSVLHGKSSFSIDFWIYSTSIGDGWLSASSSTQANEFLVFNDGDKIDLWIKDFKVEFEYNVPLHEWMHVAVCRDGNTGEGRIYVNGELIGRGDFPTGALNVSDNALIFGNDQDDVGGGGLDATQQFNGILDNLTFYNMPLCQYQVEKLYEENLEKIESVFNDTICGPGNTRFKTSGASIYNWYLNEKDQVPIAMQNDSTLETFITETTTLWVAADNLWTESSRMPVSVHVSPRVYIDSITYPSNPTVSYSFDSSNGDDSGNGYDVEFGEPAFSDGVIGESYYFEDFLDVVKIPHEVLDKTTDFTISFWIQTTSSGDGIISGANDIQDNELLVFLTGEGFIQLNIRDSCNEDMEFPCKTSSITRVNDGLWHHILLSGSMTNGTSRIYVDGQKEPTLVGYHSLEKIEISPNGLYLGNDQDILGGGFNENQQFKGKIDELKIYRRVLDDYEIAALYQGRDYINRPLSINLADSICDNDSSQLVIINPQLGVTYNVEDSDAEIIGSYAIDQPLDSVKLSIPFTANLSIVGSPTGWSCLTPIDTFSQVSINSDFYTQIIFTPPNELCNSINTSSYQWWLNGFLFPQNSQCINVTQEGVYQAVAIIDNCLTNISEFYWAENLSPYRLYPNPSNNGELNIDLSESKSTIETYVFNALGEVVYYATVENRDKIQLSLSIPSGVYFVRLRINEEEEEVFKFVVN